MQVLPQEDSMMQALPQELLQEIIKHCAPDDVATILPQVSTEFLHALTPRLYEMVIMSHWPKRYHSLVKAKQGQTCWKDAFKKSASLHHTLEEHRRQRAEKESSLQKIVHLCVNASTPVLLYILQMVHDEAGAKVFGRIGLNFLLASQSDSNSSYRRFLVSLVHNHFIAEYLTRPQATVLLPKWYLFIQPHNDEWSVEESMFDDGASYEDWHWSIGQFFLSNNWRSCQEKRHILEKYGSINKHVTNMYAGYIVVNMTDFLAEEESDDEDVAHLRPCIADSLTCLKLGASLLTTAGEDWTETLQHVREGVSQGKYFADAYRLLADKLHHPTCASVASAQY